MLVVDKKTFLLGTAMAVTFFIVLFLMFLPLFRGINAFEASDRLFNSIAKGSSNYLADLREKTDGYRGSAFTVNVELKTEDMVLMAVSMLSKAGTESDRSGARLTATGDLSRLAGAILEDSEAMFRNQGKEISLKYGYPEKEVLFVWWSILKEMRKAMESKRNFKTAAFLDDVMRRGVEVAYNFYGIEPKKASANVGVLTGALLFYILYTLWWGYAILHLFNGFGLSMKAGAKKEV